MYALSTKPLTSAQQALAQRLGLQLDSLSLLRIELRGEAAEPAWAQPYDGWVLSSQNALQALADRWPPPDRQRPLAVVGSKTAAATQAQSLRVALQANRASELAPQIEAAGWQRIAFFCGNQRRDELPDYLRQRRRQVDEYVVYRSHPQPQTIDLTLYQGVLFFSPSGVRTWLQANAWPKDKMALAIGPTTAAAFAEMTGQTAKIATESTVEGLLALAASQLRI
jgi:uroporphyrinogen-III synthase